MREKTEMERLQFLKFVVQTAPTKMLPYAVDFKSVLLTLFQVDHASHLRAAVSNILTQVGQRHRHGSSLHLLLVDRIVRRIE